MSGADLTAYAFALKERYTTDRIEDMVYRKNPLIALLPKDEDFGGEHKVIPVVYANPQARSAGFAQAQSRSTAASTAGKKFLVTRVKNYAIGTVDGETMEASKGDANAFMAAATTEMDGALNTLTRDLATDAYRSGWGSRGTIGAISGNDITLAQVEDVVNFEVGMVCVYSASESAATLRDSGDSLTITAINRSTGVLTHSSAVSGVSGAAVGDHVFVKGDRQDSATPSRLKITGLEGWCPFTAPSAAESFFGVDRTADVTRLAGHRFDGSSAPIEEALIEAEAIVSREGGALDHLFISHKKMAELKKALGTKVQYVDLQANPRVSFRGVMLDGNYGPIKVIADQNCPSNRAFGLELSMWKLCSIGKAVRILNADGLDMLRQANDDGVEFRVGFYGNLACKGPGWNVSIKL